MPFQTTFSQTIIPSGIIQSVNAGPDANSICDLNFTLTASVVGDLQGHVIVWEQLTGSPVTFTTPLNQLSVSYSQTIFDNKTFRFYIDRGTAFEMFDDVMIFGSPTTNSIGTISATAQIIANSTTSNEGEKIELRLLTPFPENPHDGMHVLDTYTEATLFWNEPETDHNIVGYILRERVQGTGQWNDIGVFPSDVNTFNPITIGNTYLVSAIIEYNNSFIGQVSSNIVWASGNLDDIERLSLTDSAHRNITITEQIVSNFDIETLVIINLDRIIDNSYRSFSTDSTLLSFDDYDIEILRIKNKDTDNDTVTRIAPNPSINSLVINNFDVLSQTGEQIGGT